MRLQFRDFGFGVGELPGIGQLGAFQLLLLGGKFGLARTCVGLELVVLRVAIGTNLGLFSVKLAAYLVQFTLRLLVILLLLLQLRFELTDLCAQLGGLLLLARQLLTQVRAFGLGLLHFGGDRRSKYQFVVVDAGRLTIQIQRLGNILWHAHALLVEITQVNAR